MSRLDQRLNTWVTAGSAALLAFVAFVAASVAYSMAFSLGGNLSNPMYCSKASLVFASYLIHTFLSAQAFYMLLIGLFA
jgi:hypothetical protein